MSIGLLTRILKVSNLLAILAIAGAGWAFWEHHQEMQKAWTPPPFVVDVEKRQGRSSRIEAIGMPLGRYPKPEEAATEAKPVETGPTIESELAKLGEIKSAMVTYPPYEGGVFPALIFEFKNNKRRTIKLNEALVTRPHPTHKNLVPIPVAYKFVGCEPDPENPGWTYFLFDMRCDGKDIQKARWKREGEDRKPRAGAPNPGPKPGTIYIGPGIEDEEPAEGATATGTTTTTEAKTGDGGTKTEVVQNDPKPPPAKEPETLEVLPGQINISDAPSGPLFEDESGTFSPTREGMDYLKDNYDKVLKEAQTRTYRDPKTKRAAGIRIVRLKGAANEFGLYPDDVILSINDKPVTRQSQAVAIVKEELKKPAVKILRVKVLRRGRTIDKRYDTRDPDIRNKARRSGFGRG